MELDGRVAIVTGATGGIGSALCDALIGAGTQVLAVGRRSARLAGLEQRHPGRVTGLTADLSSETGRTALTRHAAAMRPAPSLAILAHANGDFGLFEQQSQAQLAASIGANFVGPALLVHALLPLLAAQPDAAIVAVGSTFGSIGYPGYSGYSASKFGMRGLFEALARERADRGPRFQYLSPRATDTDFNAGPAMRLNQALGVSCDSPERVAAELLQAIRDGRARKQIGWPEKLFARLNGLWPELVDRSLRKQLPTIRQYADRHTTAPTEGELHESRLP